MRHLFPAAAIAFVVAVLITVLAPARPLEEQLLHLQVQRAAPEMTQTLSDEPAALQALFLTYADDPVLLLKSQVALLRYPELARPIFLSYGDSDAFKGILRAYGEDVLLPIQYFLANEIFTLELMHGLNETARSALERLHRIWGGDTAEPGEPSQPPAGDAATSARNNGAPLSSEERGWYAIHFIEAEGYGFIGQFVQARDGTVSWVQTERLLEAVNQFFAGGIRGLETRVRRDESIAAADLGWAAVDVAVGVSAFKLLRMGRTGAAAGAPLTFSQRTAAIGSGLWRGSMIGVRAVKYGAPAVIAYMAIRHPSVIHSLLAEAAERLGLPVAWVQVGGWTLLLLPVLLVLRLLTGPLVWLLSGVIGVLRWRQRSRYT